VINVTKTYLPPFDEYSSILKKAWDSSWITNNGELVQELEQKLKSYLGVKHLFFTNNGTIVLQMALKALEITKEVITTPFSYVATTNAILWEKCKPVFVDIDTRTFCIDAGKLEAAITEDTQAILATHVYGLPCNIDAIQSIATKYNLKVIYDGAHAFGSQFKNKSLLSFGDISTCIEGGCIICNDDKLAQQLMLFRQFGHVFDDYFSIGINAKNSEFHAAMGLAVLPKVPELISKRKQIFEQYKCLLGHLPVELIQAELKDLSWNYSYYPVIFQSEETLLDIKDKLFQNGYNTRRYFFPSLNKLPFLIGGKCEVAEDVASRILCLPFFPELEIAHVNKICTIISSSL
jgi:dTDP-4-amino-4,6-dideoxygalactose transaminase